MKCGHQDLKWRLYLMVQCVGQMYGPLHHDLRYFPCSLRLLYVQYDDALEMTTKNVLAYHMCWSQYLGSCCFLWAFISLGLRLGIWICYNMNWTKKSLISGPHKIMRRPPSLPMLYYCLVPILPHSYIPCLSGDCDLSRRFLKAWGISWGLVSAS